MVFSNRASYYIMSPVQSSNYKVNLLQSDQSHRSWNGRFLLDSTQLLRHLLRRLARQHPPLCCRLPRQRLQQRHYVAIPLLHYHHHHRRHRYHPQRQQQRYYHRRRRRHHRFRCYRCGSPGCWSFIHQVPSDSILCRFCLENIFAKFVRDAYVVNKHFLIYVV